MSEPIDTIEISDEFRIAVYPDTDAENPRKDWDTWITTFVAESTGRRGNRDAAPAVHADELDVERADAHFTDRPIHGRRGQPVEEIVARWARIFHDRVVEWDYDRRGYWYVTAAGAEQVGVDWPMTIEDQAKQITAERHTYEQWANGEVYQVDLEQKAHYVRVDKNDEPVFLADDLRIERWEYVDGLGGCYLDDEYTALAVAVEHFAGDERLDEDEQATLQALAAAEVERAGSKL
jgi:hypothetical protein